MALFLPIMKLWINTIVNKYRQQQQRVFVLNVQTCLMILLKPAACFSRVRSCSVSGWGSPRGRCARCSGRHALPPPPSSSLMRSMRWPWREAGKRPGLLPSLSNKDLIASENVSETAVIARLRHVRCERC